MGRRPCCSKEQELNKGAWTTLEDKILTKYIQIHGEGKWRNLPERAGLKRCGKSCRLRWLNYLRPGIKRGSITEEEEDLIIRLHKLLGNRWALIAGRLPGRTDNEIKNYWHTKLSKTLKPKPSNTNDQPLLSNPNNKHLSEKPEEPRLENNRTVKTSVVRTKATRFNKPVVSLVPRVMEDSSASDDSSTASEIDQYQPSDLTSSRVDHMMMSSEEGLVEDFGVNFDMDKDFFSGFFGTDWISELPSCPENYSGDRRVSESGFCGIVEGNNSMSSEQVNPVVMPGLSSDLESIVSLIETENLEDLWLQV